MYTRNIELSVVSRNIEHDDGTLVTLYYKAKDDAAQKQRIYQNSLSNYNENDYLSFMLAKLAYDFAKEELESLDKEIQKRGLITTN